jgi:predicted nuclease of restriction endonuclease-like (RecB) superfamily
MGVKKRKYLGKKKESVGIPIPEPLFNLPNSYYDFIKEIKRIVTNQKVKIFRIANSEMIMMYWYIGNAVLEKQKLEGWGTKVIDRMSYDLKDAFPDMNGFSSRNIKYMRKFAESWEDIEFVQRCVAQIAWRTNIISRI